ncbi:MAG: hypothetical protein Q8P38_08000 [Candidatus Nanopelagicales bacterium]|nr:hypothetical protein [Candidatus Nanopelagicales bacterium]
MALVEHMDRMDLLAAAVHHQVMSVGILGSTGKTVVVVRREVSAVFVWLELGQPGRQDFFDALHDPTPGPPAAFSDTDACCRAATKFLSRSLSLDPPMSLSG